jgi:RNA polymerase sigma-70 factor (ECF subfamily)
MDRIVWINRFALYLWLFSGPELQGCQDALRARAQAMGQDLLALLAGTPGVADLPGLDDGRLVLAVRKGFFRNEAFQVLYNRYAEYLVSCLMPRWGIDPHTAEDLVHDLFLCLLVGKFDAYEPGRPFRPYFHQVAHNAAVGWLRRRNGTSLGALPDNLAGNGKTVLEQVAHQELQEDIARALAEMPARYGDILQRSLQGQGYPQIMRELGLTYPAAAGRLHRARQLIREQLSGHALTTLSG